jgi:hypothetical protein
MSVTFPQPPGDPVDSTGGARMEAVHSVLLHTGKVLCVDAHHGDGTPHVIVFDPSDCTIR